MKFILGFCLILTIGCLDTDGKIEGSSLSENKKDFPGGNYFVYTRGRYPGDLGGLNGADQICLNELRLHYWRGKENFLTIKEDQVRAFLCEANECRSLAGDEDYNVSFAGESVEGLKFRTDLSGVGPGHTEAGEFRSDYWTGRSVGGSSSAWSETPSVAHCSSWENSIGVGRVGVASFNDESRWSHYDLDCTEYRGLICIVESN